MRSFYPIILLTISNIFMTFAWYGHLRFKSQSLWVVILASWFIAFLNIVFRFRQIVSVMTFSALHSLK